MDDISESLNAFGYGPQEAMSDSELRLNKQLLEKVVRMKKQLTSFRSDGVGPQWGKKFTGVDTIRTLPGNLRPSFLGVITHLWGV